MTPGTLVIVQPRKMHSAQPWRGVVVKPSSSGTVRTGAHGDEMGLEHVGPGKIAVRPSHPHRGYSTRPVVVPVGIVRAALDVV